MWLKRIFGKKEPESHSAAAPATKRLSLAEAKGLVYERISAKESDALKTASAHRESLVQAVDGLKAAVRELAVAKVPEPTATASRNIKDGFAQRALGVLSRVGVPRFNSVSGLQADIMNLRQTLAGVSVGPREAMHVGFFFEKQMSDIAARIRSVFEMISGIQACIEPATVARKAAEKAMAELNACMHTISDKKEKIAQAELEINGAKAALSSVQWHDLSELVRLRGELSKLGQALASADQAVVAGVSPALRLLKRFGHTDEQAARFVQRLEVAPAAVFYDDCGRVKATLAGALAAVRSGAITADEKEVRRGEEVLKRFEELTALCERRVEIVRGSDELNAAIEREAAKERENTAAADMMKSLENTIAQTEMRVLNLRREISEAEQSLDRLKQKLAEQLAPERVEIVS